MQAVIYHADAEFAWGGAVKDTYKRLCADFRKQCNGMGMKLIHLTLDGHPGWGDLNFHYDGLDPKNVVLNREECFVRFLETAPDDVYWFCEPDYKIVQMWPLLKTDCAMIYRAWDAVPMCPAWRMATKKALPFFTLLRDTLRAVKVRPGVGHDWHGDSEAFTKVWEQMSRPTVGITTFKGMSFEFRAYTDYIKGTNKYSRNYMGKRKMELLRD